MPAMLGVHSLIGIGEALITVAALAFIMKTRPDVLEAKGRHDPCVVPRAVPIVETMAALPSVILGFLAGLWLAPYVQHNVPAIFAMPLVLLVLTMASLLGWRSLPLDLRGKFREGTELLLLVPVYVFGIYLSLKLGQPLERLFLGHRDN